MSITITDTPADPIDTDGPSPGLTLVFSRSLARAGEQISLAGRSAALIGRDASLFPGGPLGDPRVSGRHAALARDGEAWVIADRGSKNGTFVNGERVSERKLSPGDAIRTGSTFIVFAPVPSSPRPAPGALIGVGAAMAAVRQSIALVAATGHTVLLLGPSGAGKEVAAREIHRLSGRDGAFVAVNCASLRGELLESELFGHVRGAFTGAQRSHDGLFLRADTGTLLLDEVAETEEQVQARLLRVLEVHAIRPVGASVEVPITTRVVAATNQDVEAAIRAGRLRTDLYARLARWTIRLPALRERREDLGVLVRALLAREAPTLDVTADLMAALLDAPWPLNVRGLANVLTTARLAQPAATQLDLVAHVRALLEAQRSLAADPPATTAAAETPPDRDRVAAALTETHGNIAAAASALGLTRQSLYRLLDRHGLDAGNYRS